VARSRVEKRPQAIRDLLEIALYLADESASEELALRFIEAAEASFEQLADMPEIGVQRDYNEEVPTAPTVSCSTMSEGCSSLNST
jgi:plasmid stabilization system protein ParE